jgi:hypothetical protein
VTGVIRGEVGYFSWKFGRLHRVLTVIIGMATEMVWVLTPCDDRYSRGLRQRIVSMTRCCDARHYWPLWEPGRNFKGEVPDPCF